MSATCSYANKNIYECIVGHHVRGGDCQNEKICSRQNLNNEYQLWRLPAHVWGIHSSCIVLQAYTEDSKARSTKKTAKPSPISPRWSPYCSFDTCVNTWRRLLKNTYEYTKTYLYIYIYIYVHIYVYIHINMFMHKPICVHLFNYTYIYINVYWPIQTIIGTHMCGTRYIYIYIYI